MAKCSNLDVMNDSFKASIMNDFAIGPNNDQITPIDVDEYNLRPADGFTLDGVNYYSICNNFHKNIIAKVDDDDDVVVGMEIILLPQQLAGEDTIGDAVTLSQEDLDDESTLDDFGTSRRTLDTNFNEHINEIPPHASTNLIIDQISGNPLCIATAAELVDFFEEDQSKSSW